MLKASEEMQVVLQQQNNVIPYMTINPHRWLHNKLSSSLRLCRATYPLQLHTSESKLRGNSSHLTCPLDS